jgi:transcription elongation factor Elf1
MCKILKCWNCKSERFSLRECTDNIGNGYYVAVCDSCGTRFDLQNREL